MKLFDVIIIGGGPSGSMAGIQLQNKGFRTCIIDKATFPREKLCGGGLTHKTTELLRTHCPEIDPTEYIVGQTDSMAFYYKNHYITQVTLTSDFYFTERNKLDTCLINLYKEKGGTLIENYRVSAKDINYLDKQITIHNTRFQYQYLIGACGCSTLFTKQFNIKRNDFFCIETSIPKEEPNDTTCRIYFGALDTGYGWYFPKDKNNIIGIGGENRDKKLVKQAVQFFNTATFSSYTTLKGSCIPSGKRINTLTPDHNILVVGDSAGLIDPVTGEGIYYALLSGLYAAESIAEATKTKHNLSSIYRQKCQSIKQNMRWGYWYMRLLYTPSIIPYFRKALSSHPHFVQYYLEEVMSSYRQSYKSFLWHYFTKVRNKQIT